MENSDRQRSLTENGGALTYISIPLRMSFGWTLPKQLGQDSCVSTNKYLMNKFFVHKMQTKSNYINHIGRDLEQD